MPEKVRDELAKRDDTSFPYFYEENVTIQLQSFPGIVRCNTYRPRASEQVPALVSYGPYGKDIHYKEYARPFLVPLCIHLNAA